MILSQFVKPLHSVFMIGYSNLVNVIFTATFKQKNQTFDLPTKTMPSLPRGLAALATPRDVPKSREAALGKPNSLSEAPRKQNPLPLPSSRRHKATKRNSKVGNAGHTLLGKVGTGPNSG